MVGHYSRLGTGKWAKLKQMLFAPINGCGLFPYGPTEHDVVDLDHQFQSMDYDYVNSHARERHLKGLSKGDIQLCQRLGWGLTLFIGIITGMVAFLTQLVIAHLRHLHSLMILHFAHEGSTSIPHHVVAIFYNLILVSIASSLVVFIEPAAYGSGIAEVKSFLNGIMYPHILRLKTLVVKLVGMILAICGGMLVGTLGPYMHVGAMIASILSQVSAKAASRPGRIWNALLHFSNDRDRRDFVSIGAAAGVAASFDAPVAGVIFALEGMASFWSSKLNWRTFLATVASAFTVRLMYSSLNGFTSFSGRSILALDLSGSVVHYGLVDIPVFVLVGCLGGLCGGLFNYCNNIICQLRNKYLHTRLSRLCECLVISLIFSCATMFLPYLFSCRPEGDFTNLLIDPIPNYCPPQQLNELNILLGSISDYNVIRMLFSIDVADEFSFISLAAFGLLVYIFSLITYGSAIPGGLTVPMLLFGSSMGRLFALGINTFNLSHFTLTPGVYAIIGASAILGGTMRTALTQAVILLEATNDTSFLLPIMIGVLSARIIADYISLSVYDLQLVRERVPYLRGMPDPHMQFITAKHIMTRHVVMLPHKIRLDRLVAILSTFPHSGFPVVFSDSRIEAMDDIPNTAIPSHYLSRTPHTSPAMAPSVSPMLSTLSPFITFQNLSPTSKGRSMAWIPLWIIL